MGFFSKVDTDVNIKDEDDARNEESESTVRADGNGGERVGFWHVMWEDMEAEFLLLGVSSTDYWDLPPATIMKLARLKREQLENEVEERLELARITAMLTGVGVNNPKQFPKTLVRKKQEEGVDSIASSIIALKNKYKTE